MLHNRRKSVKSREIQPVSRKFKSVLITGGCGFIGSNFVRHFYHAHPDYFIVNLDLLSYCGNPENLLDIERLESMDHRQKRYVFVHGDICNVPFMESLFKEYHFDLVIHFAAESHVDRSIFSDVDFVRTNIEGTRALIEAARRYQLPRFIHISTDEVYGSIAKGHAKEEAPLQPSNPYAASKAGVDLLIQAYMKTHAFPAIIVRGSNNYGPYQYPEKLIPLAITNLIEGKKVPIHGNGHHVRSWLHVNDFCRAIDLAAHEAPNFSIYNVAGEEKTNLEVLKLLAKHLKVNLANRKMYINDRPGADERYAPDGGKIKKKLKFGHIHSFERCIGKVVRWYLDNPEWWRNIRLKKGFVDHYERQSKGLWC